MSIGADVSDSQDVKVGTVLVVEDDEANQWVTCEILKHEGFTVISAVDGRTALQEIANQNIDLILLDLNLPDIDGYEVVRQIRQRESMAGGGAEAALPVIALTGMVSEEEKQSCLTAGMDDFLAKPFLAEQLIAKSQSYIRARGAKNLGQQRVSKRSVPNVSVLVGEIFNENDALNRASGDRKVMVGRIKAFLRKAPETIDLLRKVVAAGEDILLVEQEVRGLKDMAMEIGGTDFADEVFSLLMQLRKKQDIGDVQSQLSSLAVEFDHFRNDPKVQQLIKIA